MVKTSPTVVSGDEVMFVLVGTSVVYVVLLLTSLLLAADFILILTSRYDHALINKAINKTEANPINPPVFHDDFLLVLFVV